MKTENSDISMEAWRKMDHHPRFLRDLLALRKRYDREHVGTASGLAAVFSLLAGVLILIHAWGTGREVTSELTMITIAAIAGFVGCWSAHGDATSRSRGELALREEWMRKKDFAPVPPDADDG